MTSTRTRTRYRVAAGPADIDTIAEGDGPLLVMLPSSSRDSEDFAPVAAALAASGLRVLRPQPRGMAGSRGALDGLTMHDYAADVAAVIRHADAGPAVVFGHAFGQWVARMLAADHPALSRGLVLAAAAAKSPPPHLRPLLARCADTHLPDADRLSALRTAFFAPGHDASVWLSGWHPEAGRSQRAASSATLREAWWDGGSAPMLDLQAARDPWRPRDTAFDLRDTFGAERVSVVAIEDASHALLPEQPDAVVTAVLDWMRTRLASRPGP
jgi:pimeloyl-ACP methyl ester carboxylesterase